MASFRIAASLVAAAFAANIAQAKDVSIDESLTGPQLSTLLAAPDFAKLSMEDSKNSGSAWRYGVQIPVDGVRIDGSSKRGLAWQSLADGRLSWTWRLVAPGAKTLDLHFADLHLPARAELVLRGEGADNLRRIAAEDLPKDSGEYWSPYVAGELVDVQIIVPADAAGDVRMHLASVTHGYRGLFEHVDPMQKSGSCNVDVACPAGTGWQDQIDSVGHYTFSQGGSSYVCTGTLVGNTAQTTTPYFLTANHCVSTQTVASSVVVYWNYQSSTCRTPGSSSSGTPLSRSIASHSQSGTTLVANYASSDFALLRLNANVPTGANAYFSGWDASGSTPSSAVGIHHPAGHEKRIAVENNALTVTGYGGGSGSTHWRVIDWDQGTTEGGSSGSGLWNQNKRLVGQLHGGSAACGNDLSDYYGRLSVSWNGGGSSTSRLRDWLAPGSSGTTTLAGYRTGGGGGPDPDPGPGVLANGVPVTGLSGAAGSERFFTLQVPAGASNLVFQMAGGSGDADLYVRQGSAPTTSSWTCRPYLSGNNETCTVASPAAGTWHVMIRGYSAYSGVSLTGSYSAGGGGGQSFFENTTDYQIRDLQTVESPISVNRSGNAPSTLKVAVRIIHTYRGDLVVNLVAPDGSTYLLHNGTGGSADNLIGTYTVNASSELAQGTWKLRVYDRYNGDTGYIDSWSLQF